MCAHLRVAYKPIDNGDGSMRERWQCEACGHTFNPYRPGELIPGLPARHMIVRDACRETHGDQGAVSEALAAIESEARKIIGAWPRGQGHQFHFVLTVERHVRRCGDCTWHVHAFDVERCNKHGAKRDPTTCAEYTPKSETDHALHPTGRCTCAGEGRCEWCRTICPVCGGGDVRCPSCDGTGRTRRGSDADDPTPAPAYKPLRDALERHGEPEEAAPETVTYHRQVKGATGAKGSDAKRLDVVAELDDGTVAHEAITHVACPACDGTGDATAPLHTRRSRTLRARHATGPATPTATRTNGRGTSASCATAAGAYPKRCDGTAYHGAR
jgi:hypothetical protein